MNYCIKEIRADDDAAICEIIQSVGAEYGAIGEGFGPSDPEVLSMSQYYQDSLTSRYLVAKVDGKVVGGCGIAPFNGSLQTCELKKLFLLPASRGLGLGQQLTKLCLDYATKKGFKQCYLDTLKNMHAAIALYERMGFKHLQAPLAGSEHGGCDVWMLKQLNSDSTKRKKDGQ